MINALLTLNANLSIFPFGYGMNIKRYAVIVLQQTLVIFSWVFYGFCLRGLWCGGFCLLSK